MAATSQLSRIICRGVCSTSSASKWSRFSVLRYRDPEKGAVLQRFSGCGWTTGKAFFSVKAKDADEDLDKPIPFTTSKAAELTAKDSLSGNAFPDAPEYQPIVVVISVGAFLLYFLALREENDFDLEMEQPIWQRIPNLERQQLHLVLDYNRSHDLDTADIEKRLKEIEQEDAAKKVAATKAEKNK